MKYKIVSKKFYSHKLNKETKLYEPIIELKYGAYRKGKIFGFWHDVGEWMTDSQGNSFCFTDWFDSIEQCKSFVQCWHDETYGEKEPIEFIIK